MEGRMRGRTGNDKGANPPRKPIGLHAVHVSGGWGKALAGGGKVVGLLLSCCSLTLLASF